MSWLSRLVVVFVALAFVSSAALGAEPKTTFKPENFEDLSSAIKAWTTMLKEKNYETLLETAIPPDQQHEAFKSETTREKFIQSFSENKAARLLTVLESIAKAQPVYNDEKTAATFNLDAAVNSKKTIQFERVEKRWYLVNRLKKASP